MTDSTSPFKRTDDGHLVWTSPDGKEQEFRLSSRVMYLDVAEVWLSSSLPYQEEGQAPKPLRNTVRGKAIMEDRGIQRIGEPETKTKTLSISFWEMDEVDAQRHQSGDYYAVSLSYSKSDWEIGNEAEWWVQIYLPPAQMQPMLEAVESGKLTKFSVGLRLQNAYVTDYYAPISLSVDWYLASDESLADLAYGTVISLIVETKPFTLLTPLTVAAPEQESDNDYNATTDQVTPDVISADALTKLATKADDLIKYTRWIFWVLVVIAFFTAVH